MPFALKTCKRHVVVLNDARRKPRSDKTTYPLQHIFAVVAKLHEQGDLPARVAVHSIDLHHEAESKGQTHHDI